MPKENKSKTTGQKSHKFVKKMVTSEVLGPSIGDAILDTIECAGALMNFVTNRTPEEDGQSEDEDTGEEPAEEVRAGDVAIQNMRILLSPRTDEVLLEVLDACCSCRIVKCKKNEQGDGEEESEGEDEETKRKEEEEREKKEKERQRQEKEEERRTARERKEEEKRLKEQKKQEEREKAQRKKKEEEEWERKKKEEEEEWKRKMREEEKRQSKIWEEVQRKRMEQEEKERGRRKKAEEDEWKRKRQEEEEEWKNKLKEEEERQRKIWEKEQRDRMEQEEREREKRKAEEEEEWKRKREEEEEEWRAKLEEEKERQRRIWEEEQRYQIEQEGREREKRRAEEEKEWKRKRQEEEEEMRRKIKEEEDRQKELWEEEQRQRLKEEEEERQKRKREEEEEWKRKRQEEEEDWKRAIKEEKEARRKIWEKEQRERMEREEEERAKRKREEEEEWKKKRQEDEEEMRRKLEEEDERQRKLWEEEQSKRLKKEEEERNRRKCREEEDWKRKRMEEEEERRRKRREKEERQNRLWEEEQRKRMEQEEREREKRKREEEYEWLRKRQEEEERQKKEWEEEEKERVRRRSVEEEECKQRRAEEEEERKRKKREKEERQKRMWEEEQRKREEEEEQERARRKREEEEEWERKRKEEKEIRMKEEEEEKRKRDEMEREKRRRSMLEKGKQKIIEEEEKEVDIRRVYDEVIEEYDESICGDGSEMVYHRHSTVVEKHINVERQDIDQELEKEDDTTEDYASRRLSHLQPRRTSQDMRVNQYTDGTQETQDRKKSTLNNCNRTVVKSSLMVEEFDLSEFDRLCGENSLDFINEGTGDQMNGCQNFQLSMNQIVSSSECSQSDDSLKNDDDCCQYNKSNCLNSYDNADRDRRNSTTPRKSLAASNKSRKSVSRRHTLNGDTNGKVDRMFSLRPSCFDAPEKDSGDTYFNADDNSNKIRMSVREVRRNSKLRESKSSERWVDSRANASAPRTSRSEKTGYPGTPDNGQRRNGRDRRSSCKDISPMPTILKTTVKEFDPDGSTLLRKTITEVKQSPRAPENETCLRGTSEEINNKDHTVFKKTVTNIERSPRTSEERPTNCNKNNQDIDFNGQPVLRKTTTELEKGVITNEGKPKVIKRQLEESAPCDDITVARFVAEAEKCHKCVLNNPATMKKSCKEINTCNSTIFEKTVTEVERRPRTPKRALNATNGQIQDESSCTDILYEKVLQYSPRCPQGRPVIVTKSKYKEVDGTNSNVFEASISDCENCSLCPEKGSTVIKMTSREVSPESSNDCNRKMTSGRRSSNRSKERSQVKERRSSGNRGTHEHNHREKTTFYAKGAVDGKRLSKGCRKSEIDITATVDSGKMGFETVMLRNGKKVRFDKGNISFDPNKSTSMEIETSAEMNEYGRVKPLWKQHTEKKKRENATAKINCNAENVPCTESKSSIRLHYHTRDGKISGTSEIDIHRRLCSSKGKGSMPTKECPPRLCAEPCGGDNKNPCGRLSTLLHAQACIAPKRQRNPKVKQCRKKPNVLWAVARINEFGEEEHTLEILSTDDKKPPIMKKCSAKNGKYNHEIFAVTHGT